ncbi:MAG: amidohydrolase family protein [Gammaproteobacteria bacterium]|nr:amidohydrolase family protein [Gammaproteobacteria bacterium]
MTLPSCMPPDPDTRKPAFRMPAKACDAHCHVFGPGHVFPYAPTRKYTPPDAPKEKLKELHRILGVERAVIVQASCHGTDNSAMLDAIAHSKGAYRGVCSASTEFSDAEFRRLHDGGIRGVRFNFVRHLGGAPDLAKMRKVVERVRELGWHLVIHVDAEQLVEFEDLFASFAIPKVIDHMGRVPTSGGIHQKPFQNLLEFMRRDDFWVKVCGSERISQAGPPFYDAVPYAMALIDVAPDRILWGTDWPHPNIRKFMPNDGDLVDLVPLFARDTALQKKVLVDNPHRLYQFDD